MPDLRLADPKNLTTEKAKAAMKAASHSVDSS
jgi:hypothetical protein